MKTIRVVTRAGDPNKFKTDYFDNIRHAVNYARQFDGKLYVGTQQLEIVK